MIRLLARAASLAEVYELMKEHEQTVDDYEMLQQRTFYGQEKKPLPTLLGLMNMVLHGVSAPNVARRNTLIVHINLGEHLEKGNS